MYINFTNLSYFTKLIFGTISINSFLLTLNIFFDMSVFFLKITALFIRM